MKRYFNSIRLTKTDQDTINKTTINMSKLQTSDRSQNCIHNLLLKIITTKQGEEEGT